MKVFASQVMHILTLTFAAYAIGHTFPVWAIKPAFILLAVGALLLTLRHVYSAWLLKYQCGVILLTSMVLWPWLMTDPGAPIVNVLGWAASKVGVTGTWLVLAGLVLMRHPLKKKSQCKTLAETWAEQDAAYAEKLRLYEEAKAKRAEDAATAAEEAPIETGEPGTPVFTTMAERRAAGVRTYLEVPFEDNGEVKYLGARFDWTEKKWYVPHYKSLKPFRDWLPKDA